MQDTEAGSGGRPVPSEPVPSEPVSSEPVPSEPAVRRARRLRALRKNSAGISVMLIAEYGLGVGVNLSVRIPAADQGDGIAAALGRALTSQPAGLAVHAALGMLLLVAGVTVLTRAIIARHRPAIAASAVGLLAIVGAAASGASFVSAGRAGAS